MKPRTSTLVLNVRIEAKAEYLHYDGSGSPQHSVKKCVLTNKIGSAVNSIPFFLFLIESLNDV